MASHPTIRMYLDTGFETLDLKLCGSKSRELTACSPRAEGLEPQLRRPGAGLVGPRHGGEVRDLFLRLLLLFVAFPRRHALIAAVSGFHGSEPKQRARREIINSSRQSETSFRVRLLTGVRMKGSHFLSNWVRGVLAHAHAVGNGVHH